MRQGKPIAFVSQDLRNEVEKAFLRVLKAFVKGIL